MWTSEHKMHTKCRLQNKTEDCRCGLPRRVTNRKRLGWTPINSQMEFYVLLSCRGNVTLLLEELPLLRNLVSDHRLSELAVILLTSHWWQPKCVFFGGSYCCRKLCWVRRGRHLVQSPKKPHQICPFLSNEPFGSFKHCSGQ